jgi:hypothetical protein
MVLFSNLQKTVFWVGLLCAHFSSTAARKAGPVLRPPEDKEVPCPYQQCLEMNRIWCKTCVGDCPEIRDPIQLLCGLNLNCPRDFYGYLLNEANCDNCEPTPSPNCEPTSSPTTPGLVPSRPGPCPSGDDIEFVYEGLAGVTCETISFFLKNPAPGSVSYSHSLSGFGSNVPGNDSIGLTPYANSVINQPDAGNYIFVAIADVPGCPAAKRTCLLDCVPGGPSPSVNDPPFCEYANNANQD